MTQQQAPSQADYPRHRTIAPNDAGTGHAADAGRTLPRGYSGPPASIGAGGRPHDYYPYNPASIASLNAQAAANHTGDFPGGGLLDGATVSSAWSGRFNGVPVHVYILVIPGGTGNLAWFATSDYCAIGEASTANSGSQGSVGTPQTTAVTSGVLCQIDVVGSFTAAAPGDFFGLDWERVGGHASDTINTNVLIVGLLVTYS